jgi:hypothetical protein
MLTGNTITLSPTTHAALRRAASRRGMKPDTYVEELLTTTLADETQSDEDAAKPYSVMDFYGVAPTGRSAAEIDAEINAARDEWDY